MHGIHGGGAVYFSVLGVIEVYEGRQCVLRPTGVMQQTLLAALLVSGGALVTVEALVRELWGNTPPAKVENALQAQVSRVRRSLGALESTGAGPRVVSSPSGYLFRADRSEIDAYVFLDSIEDLLEKEESINPRTGIEILRGALSLWRGPVFGGLAGGPICQAATAKCVESRHSALTLLYELELKVGRHAQVLPELAELYAQNPTHEKFCMLLMRALYRTGRQRDALDVYRACRRNLVENLGIEPTPALRQYEKAILTHDPLLT
ncbi:AfsR/SARP family transcriptional regulator [Streptomyces sp. NPDC048428]|uniref:AfsR/SARP family transcriptional regulator n=1 Tax=Streptomyces sp. NPDC048428 TaxID=3154503 RepID=UPI003415E219